MEGNQSNLFKMGVNDNTYHGSMSWGGYVAWIQDKYGDDLTSYLTGYSYLNNYLFEVYRGR